MRTGAQKGRKKRFLMKMIMEESVHSVLILEKKIRGRKRKAEVK